MAYRHLLFSPQSIFYRCYKLPILYCHCTIRSLSSNERNKAPSQDNSKLGSSDVKNKFWLQSNLIFSRIRLPSFLTVHNLSFFVNVNERFKKYWNRLSAPGTAESKENFFKSMEPKETSEVKSKKSFSKTGKYFVILGTSFIVLLAFSVFELGKPMIDDEGEEVTDQFSEMPLWKQYILRCLKQIENFIIIIKEPSREKLLPDPLEYPYYQPPYTLVIEFTDVMVHPDWTYKTGWRFKKRPGIDYLLENLVGLYEIVVFTAEPGMTIFPVIEAVDQKNLISYKLVRDSTHFVDGHHVKNLSRLNRDLSKVIVVDWNAESVKFHPENHLQINQWKGNDDDRDLIDLTCFLKTIATTEIQDVREVLTYYKQFPDPLAAFREKQRQYFELQEQKVSESNNKKPNPINIPIKNVFQQIL